MFNFKAVFNSSSKSVSPIEARVAFSRWSSAKRDPAGAATQAARAQAIKDNYEAEQQKVKAEEQLQQARIKHAERKAQDDYAAEMLRSAKDISKEISQLVGDVKSMKINTAKNKAALISESIKIQSLFDEIDSL